MKRPLLLALLAGTVLAAPLAQAQSSSTLVLAMPAAEDPLPAGGRLVLGGTATFTADLLVYGNTQGVPVTYTVSNAPAWASVVVSPQTDVFPVMVGAASPSYTVSRAFTVLVDGAPTGPDNEIGTIEITATATPTMQGSRAATARLNTPVRFDAGEEACEDHAAVEQVAYAYVTPGATAPTADAEADADATAQDDTTTTVQSTSTTPIALPAAAILGFGAVGAGVGLLLRRRRG